MKALKLKPASECKFDILALGEVMLRLDPGESRIRTARQFNVWEGGGEYNVARGLRRCFNQRASVVTAIVRNEVGLLLEDLILQGGVDTSLIIWIDDDGIGRCARNGLNFTERGFGIRGAIGCSDRGHTAVSQISPGDIDWDYIFGELGVRWLHTGGIFAGLSDSTSQVVIDAAKVAQKYGTIVSYDLNYRPSLWKQNGGLQQCRIVNRKITDYVDVLIGNEGHYSACLGIDIEGGYEESVGLDFESFKQTGKKTLSEFSNVKIVAATIRKVKTVTVNDWGSMCYANNEIYTSSNLQNLEILDRVGGGDSFASGFIYGLMKYNDPQRAIDYGKAHGALAMTTPGDTTMASLSEV